MAIALVSLLVLALLGDLAALSIWYACSTPQSQFLGPALVRGPEEGQRIALTFDDGPAPPFTEQILEILRDRRVPAAFFVCGREVERFPDTSRQIHAEGHTIGNHTYGHPYLAFLSSARMAEEIDQTQEAIQAIVGRPPTLFRPPYGVRWLGLYSLLQKRGMQVVTWSDMGYDWEKPSEAIVEATLRHLAPGSIILLHDGRQSWERMWEVVVRRMIRALGFGEQIHQPVPPPFGGAETVKALPAIIDGARKHGFEFVPVEQFLHTPPMSNDNEPRLER